MMSNGWQADDINIQYGIFSGQYMVMINIPIALANAASTAVLPSVSGSFATGDMAGARHKINEAVQMTMFLCIPAAVGMGVLADPIMHLLFPTTTAMAGKLLMAGAVSVIFYSLSTITNGVLQGIGKPSIPVRHAAVSLVLNVAVLCALTKFTGLGIYSVLIATIVYSLSMCILNGRSVTKHLDYHMDIKGMFMKPLVASLLMGVAALVVYYGLHRVISSNVICLVPAIVVAVLVYGVAYLMIAKPSRELLRKMPGGAYLVKIAAKFRIFS
jgi:stage V sporulation protein B